MTFPKSCNLLQMALKIAHSDQVIRAMQTVAGGSVREYACLVDFFKSDRSKIKKI